MRKQWSKEFERADARSVSDQIAYLKKMLKDLGMTGRLTLEAAKQLGARRALEKEAAELGIAGQEPEANITAGRQRRAAVLKKPPLSQAFVHTNHNLSGTDSEQEEQSATGTATDVEIVSRVSISSSRSEAFQARLISLVSGHRLEGACSKKENLR